LLSQERTGLQAALDFIARNYATLAAEYKLCRCACFYPLSQPGGPCCGLTAELVLYGLASAEARYCKLGDMDTLLDAGEVVELDPHSFAGLGGSEHTMICLKPAAGKYLLVDPYVRRKEFGVRTLSGEEWRRWLSLVAKLVGEDAPDSETWCEVAGIEPPVEIWPRYFARVGAHGRPREDARARFEALAAGKDPNRCPPEQLKWLGSFW
jgi:hypothetical protein